MRAINRCGPGTIIVGLERYSAEQLFQRHGQWREDRSLARLSAGRVLDALDPTTIGWWAVYSKTFAVELDSHEWLVKLTAVECFKEPSPIDGDFIELPPWRVGQDTRRLRELSEGKKPTQEERELVLIAADLYQGAAG